MVMVVMLFCCGLLCSNKMLENPNVPNRKCAVSQLDLEQRAWGPAVLAHISLGSFAEYNFLRGIEERQMEKWLESDDVRVRCLDHTW